jgi:hypothetical protein
MPNIHVTPNYNIHLLLAIDYFKCILISSFACMFTNIFLLNEKIENTCIIIIGVIKAH